MGDFRAIGATLLLCLSFCLGAGGARAEYRGPFMTIGHATLQPIGHKEFCVEHSDECRPARNGMATAPAPVDLGTAVIAAVAGVNARVNGAIKARSDEEIYGVEERWAYPATQGDCEDYALLKRRILIKETRIDPGNLLLTVVRKENGEGHAVLTLRTTRGDFVLDNLDWRIRSWRDVPYTFVKRQSSSDPGAWIDIEDDAQLLVGAVEK